MMGGALGLSWVPGVHGSGSTDNSATVTPPDVVQVREESCVRVSEYRRSRVIALVGRGMAPGVIFSMADVLYVTWRDVT